MAPWGRRLLAGVRVRSVIGNPCDVEVCTNKLRVLLAVLDSGGGGRDPPLGNEEVLVSCLSLYQPGALGSPCGGQKAYLALAEAFRATICAHVCEAVRWTTSIGVRVVVIIIVSRADTLSLVWGFIRLVLLGLRVPMLLLLLAHMLLLLCRFLLLLPFFFLIVMIVMMLMTSLRFRLLIGGCRIEMQRVQNATCQPEPRQDVVAAAGRRHRGQPRDRRRGRVRRGSAGVRLVSIWNHPII